MKGFVTISTSLPAKRRWRPPAAVVLVLVFFSLLVPLDFLFGLHRRFPAGYSSDDRPPSEIGFRHLGHLDGFSNFPQGDTSKIKKLVRRFGSSLSKDASGNPRSKQDEIFNNKPISNSSQQLSVIEKVLPVPSDSLPISIRKVLAYAKQSRERSNYEHAALIEKMQEFKRQIEQESEWSPNGLKDSSNVDGMQAIARSSYKMIEAVMQSVAEGKVQTIR